MIICGNEGGEQANYNRNVGLVLNHINIPVQKYFNYNSVPEETKLDIMKLDDSF